MIFLSEEKMASTKMLEEFGFPPEEIAAFLQMEESRQYFAQERLLRKHRKALLEGIHRDEKRLADLDLQDGRPRASRVGRKG